MIYFTSDLHFGHDKEFLYKPRGYDSIFEHDIDVINKYNQIVNDDDIVYILGDVYMLDPEYGINCLKQLKGEKHIIRGNHDSDLKWDTYKDYAILEGYATMIKYGKFNLYLCHYPTMTSNIDDENKHLIQHIICLCGHTHFKEKFYNDNPYIYNVALDAHDNKPVSINEIIEDIRTKHTELNNLQYKNSL